MSDKKLIYNQYEHGGARFYFEGDKPKSLKRDLIIDCYQDEEFALYIKKCIEEYFTLTQTDQQNDE